MKKTRAILFDLDGVLVFTEPLKAEAHAATIKQFGGNVPASLYNSLIGQDHETVRGAFITASTLRIQPDKYTHLYREIYRRLLETDLKITPGSVELVRQLFVREYLLAVVTSTSKRAMQMILASAELARFFSAFVTSDDVSNKKPAADAYALALNRLKVSSNSAVAIEDSETGIDSAHKAGISVLAFRHSLNTSHDFSHADAVIDSLLDYQGIIQKIDYLLNSKSA